MRFSGSPPKLFCFFAFSAKKQLTAARFRDKLVLPLKGFIFLCSFLKVFPCPRGRQTIPLIRRCRKMRVKITLACTECKQRNYNTMKNKKNDPDRLEMNKYCRFCRKHTLHREAK